MSNTIKRSKDGIIKTFSDHMDYVREVSIYDKLKGTGLVPSLLSRWDGNIEHEFIEGINFSDMIDDVKLYPEKFAFCAGKFFDWYKAYREKTRISTGETDFSDFIVTRESLVCIDLEHCRPGYAEDDVAKLTADVCFSEGNYSSMGLANAVSFVNSAKNRIELSSERLYMSVKNALIKYCDNHGINPIVDANEYIASAVCTSFTVLDNGDDIKDVINLISESNQMWTCFYKGDVDSISKEIRCLLGCDKEDAEAIYLTEHNSMVELPLLLKTENAFSILKLCADTKMNLRDAVMLRMNNKGIPFDMNN